MNGRRRRELLERVLNKSRRQCDYGDRTYGARHDRLGRHADLSRIADMIRDDIALARVMFPAATTPDQVAVNDPIGNATPGICFRR